MPQKSNPTAPEPVEIVEFSPTDEVRLSQTAVVLHEAMKPISAAWPTVDAALGEVLGLAKIRGGIVLIALDLGGEVCGLVGAQPKYPGEVMELHPIAVASRVQGRGVGRALIAAIEGAVRKTGCGAIMLGTDDEAGLTSLAGQDLYPNPLYKLEQMTLPGRHPVGFYQRMGFNIVGVIPDANGFGKPDIWMAKRIAEKK